MLSLDTHVHTRTQGPTVYIEQQPVIPDNNHRTLVSRASKIKLEVGHQNLRDKFVPGNYKKWSPIQELNMLIAI